MKDKMSGVKSWVRNFTDVLPILDERELIGDIMPDYTGAGEMTRREYLYSIDQVGNERDEYTYEDMCLPVY